MSDKMLTPVDMTRQMENEEFVNPDDIAAYKEYFDRMTNHSIGKYSDDTAKGIEAEKEPDKENSSENTAN